MVMPKIKPKKFKAKLIYKEHICPKVFEAKFELLEPTQLEFIAGQTMMLFVGDNIHRSMSIASPPKENKIITIWHDVSPMGPGSKWMIALNIGDVAEFMAPLGVFVLNKESHRKRVFVATGTGVAPYHSMLLDYLEQGGTDDITLYWGLRFEEDIYKDSEFRAIAEKHPNFRYVLTLSRPTEQWQGKKGRVTDHVFVDEANITGSDFYLCGNQAMVKEMITGLEVRGVPKEQIVHELFY